MFSFDSYPTTSKHCGTIQVTEVPYEYMYGDSIKNWKINAFNGNGCNVVCIISVRGYASCVI